MTETERENKIWSDLSKIKGGYSYDGICSCQLCFPLKSGGELRFGIYDDGDGHIEIDLYGGEIPPGVTGPAKPTGNMHILDQIEQTNKDFSQVFNCGKSLKTQLYGREITVNKIHGYEKCRCNDRALFEIVENNGEKWIWCGQCGDGGG